MIGLAICNDGQQADYVTDQEAWPMMMPEPEQAVVMHNAKFDRLKLHQAGLPLPGRWEDTLIAAHLLDENGEHGLKPLAKSRLGVDDPLTFEEADRMRLLDPAVFSEYARNDSRYTFRLWQQFEPQLAEQGLMKVYELEKALVPVVTAMEEAGMKIDLQMLRTLGTEVDDELGRHQGRSL
jgi:DNA polymerase-1